MILFDCGNTLLKWQVIEQGILRRSGGLNYHDNWTERLGQQLDRLGQSVSYLTSVLDDQRQRQLERLLTTRRIAFQRFCSAQSELGVSSAYENPHSLGDDRWMALLAAHAIAPGGSLVIDAGSAITLDLLRADGQHLGGAIIPGTRTGRDHFRDIFSYIDLAELRADPTRPPGCSTPAAIHIDYDRDSLEILVDLLQQWQKLLANDAEVLLAGGDADRVEGILSMPVRRVPELVFTGMRLVIENQGQQPTG